MNFVLTKKCCQNMHILNSMILQLINITIKAIREYERIQKKICRQKMSIMFNEICIYIYIYIYISSCHAASADLPSPLFPFVSIVHRSWDVFKATSYIGTELLYIGSS